MKRNKAASFALQQGSPANSTGVTREGYLYDAAQAVLAKGLTRRGFLKSVAIAGATLVVAPTYSILRSKQAAAVAAAPEFSFAILADSHTMGAKNALMKIRLAAAIREINMLDPAPDFVMYLGDAIHDGSPEQFKYFEEIMAALKPKVFYVAGEHDWYLDMGEYYQSHFIKAQAPYYSFDHKGAHVLALHGVNLNDFWTARKLTPEQRMDIAGTINDPIQGPFSLGKAQLDWMEKDLARVPTDAPILVFSHTPLYQYYRPWNFWTEDAAAVHAILRPFNNVQVFHAHVHQLVQHQIANIKFTGVLSTSWPHPYPETYHTLGLQGQMPRSNPALPFDGLGWHSARLAGRTLVAQEDILWTLRPPVA